MHLNAIYVNPFHEVGLSGSIYSVSDYYRFNQDFFGDSTVARAQLRKFVSECREAGLDVIMDLVANHSAINSPLTVEHPEWYLHTCEGKLVSPQTFDGLGWTTWSDLAKFDHERAVNTSGGLIKFFEQVCLYYINMGFTGFRCDAAYHAPPKFWANLISGIKEKCHETLFLAETFMAPLNVTDKLVRSGFDYIFNSAKWWNFREEWCIEQQQATCRWAPSIAAPETHDSARLMTECAGDVGAFLQRVYFTALFSKGFMIPSGCEFGFRKQLNCVSTTKEDWESTPYDFRWQIGHIMRFKQKLPALREEAFVEIADSGNSAVVIIKKAHGAEEALIIINQAHGVRYIGRDVLCGHLQSTSLRIAEPDEWVLRPIMELEVRLSRNGIAVVTI